jgi:hypothetical protein
MKGTLRTKLTKSEITGRSLSARWDLNLGQMEMSPVSPPLFSLFSIEKMKDEVQP